MTGASGSIYAVRFLKEAANHFDEIYLMATRQALQVAATELSAAVSPEKFTVAGLLGSEHPNIKALKTDDFFTPPASGSFVHDGMVVVPCSMGTLGRIAHGTSDDLITRAADVCLKERRRLVLVPREMPLSLTMIQNMALVTQAGAIVLPAMPAWYGRPTTLEDLADTVVARMLQAVGVSQGIVKPWMSDA
ncbi:MAG: UbiX family flavin prenyltransferase [Armatimonadetes bacterium]|nr:UbiX family flavin prenyltransferase [Armatimonadota bacterium]NOG92036.1 UbiX family flavin prenyltransferase [Armatimonadota bacterium]